MLIEWRKIYEIARALSQRTIVAIQGRVIHFYRENFVTKHVTKCTQHYQNQKDS